MLEVSKESGQIIAKSSFAVANEFVIYAVQYNYVLNKSRCEQKGIGGGSNGMMEQFVDK